jgi:hypothetical protein
MHEDSTKIWRTLVKLALLGTTGYMTWQALTRLMGADWARHGAGPSTSDRQPE